MVREVYTAQMEDLASHGYIVAAISHPYDAILTILPNGRSIQHDSKRWPTIPSVEGEANLNQLEWHAEDIRFVLNELSKSNDAASSTLPIAAHMDLARAGAFGHSFGGMAAAHACQIEARLKACLDEDGEAAMRPFYLDDRGWGMDQAFLLMERAAPKAPPSDRDLAAMKLTREVADEVIARLHAYQDHVLESTGEGSYRVVIRRETTTHMDFSDLPVLGAHDNAEAKKRTHVLEVIENYTRGFFDHYLMNADSPAVAGEAQDGLIEAVQKFSAAKPPCETGHR